MQTVQQFPAFRQEFVKYLHDQNYIEEESLEVLKNLKVAISGNFLIHNIIRFGNINLFQGFSKYQISRYVKRLMDCFQKHSIKLIVVFEGIIFNKDVKPNFQDIAQKVKVTWQKILEDPKDPSIMQLLNELTPHFFSEMEMFKVLSEFDVEYIHAPYYSISQMKWFADYSYVHMVCCGLEGTLFNFNHIIVDFDLLNEKFYYIDIKKFRAAGFDLTKTFNFYFLHGFNPNIHSFIPVDCLDLVHAQKNSTQQEPKPTEYSFDKLKEQVITTNNIHELAKSDDHVAMYHSHKKKLDYNLAFNSECEVIMPNQSSYESVNEYYGPYFPPEVYIFLVYNLIDRELVDSIANGYYVIRPPLSDSAEYHHHIDNFFKMMLERITGVFTHKLNTKFKTGNYSLMRFYFPDKPSNFTPREFKQPKFFLKQSLISRDKSDQHNRSKKVGFCRVLQHFAEYAKENAEEPTKRTVSNRKESLDFVLTSKFSPLGKHKSLEETLDQNKEADSPEHSEKSSQSAAELNPDQPQTTQEILCYLYLTFLEMYEYVSTEKKNLMVIGAALRKCDENFEESLVILLELMKPNLCLVNGREFSNSKVRKASTEAPFNTSDKREHLDHAFYQINLWKPNIDDTDKQLIVLISRVFSLINASVSSNYPESNFEDYDYDLCQYLGVLKHVQKMLRFSFESVMLTTYFTYCSKKDIKIFLGLRKHLPFRNNLNVSLGVAIKKLLQTKESLAEFQEKNPHFVTLEYDLKAGYTLWENVFFLLKYQEFKGEFSVELLELFKKANELLTRRFKELRLVEE